jgi:hypothetical protein
MTENKAVKFFAAVLLAAILVACVMIFVGPAPTTPAAAPDGHPQRRPEKLSPERWRKSVGPEREREGKG